MGVEFRFNSTVGVDITLDELDTHYNAVFLSIGTWKESEVKLPGTELTGVMSALHFLEGVLKREQTALGRKVAIIGGGNAAIDSARTARRMRADVTIVYRRERKEMPAIKEETAAAEAEGAKFLFLAAPHRILGDANSRVRGLEVAKTRLGSIDTSGRRRPVETGEVFRVECDTVILAVGERVDSEFVQAAELKTKSSGTVDVDRHTLESSRSRFYAGGDVVSGAANVSNAMGFGKKAARNIDLRLTGENRLPAVMPQFEYGQSPPDDPSPIRRQVSAEVAATVRVSGFDEVVVGLTCDQALDAARRCLRCDLHEDGHDASMERIQIDAAQSIDAN